MHLKTITPVIFAGLLAPSVFAAPSSPDAYGLLRQMSSKLASAGTFTFEATREIDPALLEGKSIREKAKVAASVMRPNKMAFKTTGGEGTRRFIADGNTLTLFDEKTKCYAMVPMRTTIDGLVEKLDEYYGFTPPLAEFAVSNPYRDLRRQAKSVTYLGRAKAPAGLFGLFGVECHRLALKGSEADAELWIGVNDSLPRKLTATFHREGNPQLRVSFSKWNLAAATPASEFIFTPPKGSQKIEIWTTAKMQSAGKR